MYTRTLDLRQGEPESFFLWGLRQSGKSSLLKTTFPNALRIDLLKSSERLPLQANPSLLREFVQAFPAKGEPVIIDEIQKVPDLLDEVHSLIEDQKISFALCGSSARKLKRGHANLLGGRAHRFELFGLSASEIGKGWNLTRMLNQGYLPRMYDHANARTAWRSYVQDYLKEEILEEGLVRSLPPFSRFLELAALSDAEIVSWQSFARDVGVSVEGVKGYFDILSDTNVGTFLPSFQLKPKRRTRNHPKFYFSEVGIVNHLAKRGPLEEGSELYGKAFENWIFHELRCYRAYQDAEIDLFYWSLTTGVEVDFVCTKKTNILALEAKASSRVHSDHLKGLRGFQEEYPRSHKRVLVCLETRRRKTDDGILILPAAEFVKALWSGELI